MSDCVGSHEGYICPCWDRSRDPIATLWPTPDVLDQQNRSNLVGVSAVRDFNERRFWRVDYYKLITAGLSLGVAMIVTVALGVPTASAAGGENCEGSGQSNVVLSTVSPFYDVENSGSPGGSACITVSATAEAFHVDSTSFNPSAPDAPPQPFVGYKALYTGCKHGACLEPAYPALASGIESEPTSWSFSSNFSQISGQFDAVYDAFFNTTPTQQNNPTGAELMVWLNYTSNETDLGGTELPDVTIEGQTYHVWSAFKSVGGSSWTRIAFQRTSADLTTSVSNLDIAPFIQAAIADGSIEPGWYQQDLEAGFEIWQGGVGLATSSFSAPTPTVASSSGSGGSGGTGGGGGTAGGTTGASGSTSASGSTAKEKAPHVSLALPECSITYTAKKCAAYRRTAGVWRYAFGFASGQIKVTKVIVTAYRYKQRGAEAKKITAKARFIGRTAWKARLGTLTQGRWRFTAVATDKDGRKQTSNTIVENINVGLAASAAIPRRASTHASRREGAPFSFPEIARPDPYAGGAFDLQGNFPWAGRQ